ncbi:Receptor-like protein 7 [Linum perenne]
MASSQNSSMKPYSLTWCFMSLLSLVPLILPVLIVSSHVPLVSGRCREDQQSLLLQLKRGLNFTDSGYNRMEGWNASKEYGKLVRWNASTDCCEWPGISCDLGGLGRVIGLDLSQEWITGGEGLDDSTALFSLQYLEMSNNRFTGIIPTSICNLANLEVVDFSNNYFNGTIPSCLSKDLKRLSVLDLRGNMLSGKIPDTFQASCALQTLDLSNNQLEGRIPKSLENCTMLEVLDVGNNKISDVFPCIQGIKSSLRVLIFRNNLFHGSLWCSYGDLTTWQQLQIVDLAFNNFSGPLNDKFLLTWEAMMQDSLRYLERLDLSNNEFNTTIPEVIGKFKAIQVLNLSHNAFSGEIPSEFGNLSNVESLDLSHNKLTGQIPNELTRLTFLSCMDLSDNNLVGRIPTGSQFQLFDNTSFGGNPNLCGQPLSKSCTDPPAPPSIIVNHEKSSIRINWDILSKVFGFFCGLALIMLPASLWPNFRIWYWPKIDSIILRMFPKLYVKDWNNRLRTRQTRRRNKRTKATQ